MKRSPIRVGVKIRVALATLSLIGLSTALLVARKSGKLKTRPTRSLSRNSMTPRMFRLLNTYISNYMMSSIGLRQAMISTPHSATASERSSYNLGRGKVSSLLMLIGTLTSDIDDCFCYADELIEMGHEPWRTLSTATALDDLRRQYIIESARCGMSVLALSGASKLSPRAIRTIIDSQVSADT